MKIAVIAKTRLPISKPFRGGLEAFTHSLCKEYLKLGHEITLYAHSDSDPELYVRGFYGDDYRQNRYFEIYENDEYLSILKEIEQGEYDVVHNNSTHELPILWGITAPIPLVTTIHTPPISKLKAAIKICSRSKNLHFILPSKSLQSFWQPYFDNGSTIIPNGVDLKKWPLIRESSEYLFWFGRIVHSKGLDIVVDTAQEIGMPLKFAGPIDDKKYFEECIQPCMGENDLYLGHLEQEQIHSYMQKAATVVNAVRWEEPFGLTNIEAMSSGVPLAGFDRGAFKEIVTVESGVIAEQKNVKYLAKAISSAIPLKSGSVRRDAERFSLQTMAERYIKLFENII